MKKAKVKIYLSEKFYVMKEGTGKTLPLAIKEAIKDYEDFNFDVIEVIK